MSPVLDEVNTLDGVDFRNALRVPERVDRAEAQGRDDCAVAKHPAIADPYDRDDEGCANRQRHRRRNHRRVPARKRGPDPVPDVPDEGRREDDADGDDDSQNQPKGGHGEGFTTAEFGDSHG